jgi:hypothetical protein
MLFGIVWQAYGAPTAFAIGGGLAAVAAALLLLFVPAPHAAPALR